MPRHRNACGGSGQLSSLLGDKDRAAGRPRAPHQYLSCVRPEQADSTVADSLHRPLAVCWLSTAGPSTWRARAGARRPWSTSCPEARYTRTYAEARRRWHGRKSGGRRPAQRPQGIPEDIPAPHSCSPPTPPPPAPALCERQRSRHAGALLGAEEQPRAGGRAPRAEVHSEQIT